MKLLKLSLYVALIFLAARVDSISSMDKPAETISRAAAMKKWNITYPFKIAGRKVADEDKAQLKNKPTPTSRLRSGQIVAVEKNKKYVYALVLGSALGRNTEHVLLGTGRCESPWSIEKLPCFTFSSLSKT